MIAADELIGEALHLSQTDRSYIASKLLESLDDDEHEISEEWLVEINRRADAVNDGTSQLTPHHQVMKEVREGLAQIRSSRRS
jgi:putative addiction module component (TIGR02574 family)